MWRSSRSFHRQSRVYFCAELPLSRSNPYPRLSATLSPLVTVALRALTSIHVKPLFLIAENNATARTAPPLLGSTPSMRLLNAKTLELCCFGEKPPLYAILSHTWEEEEVTFQDIQHLEAASRLKGYAKIQGCCRQALIHGYNWVWIDTCCIDKTSSSELSEAINSMYKWYQESSICYAYLADIPEYLYDDLHDVQIYCSKIEQDLRVFAPPSAEDREAYGKVYMTKSRWFTRGWTLQELIAPRFVEFYSNTWTSLGTRSSLEMLLSLRTRIPVDVLRGKQLSTYCVSQRMSWASDRITTREEDLAYCLFGLFKVNMPLLYGEGSRAFFRLQEEILRRTEDMSLLAWADKAGVESAYGYCFDDFRGHAGVFAPNPCCFNLDGKVEVYDKQPQKDHKFSDIQTTWSNKTYLQYDPPLITSRGIIATILLNFDNLAFIHTGATLYEVPTFFSTGKKLRPPLGPPREFSICVALDKQRWSASGSPSFQLIHSETSQPTVMERYHRSVLYCLDSGDIRNFRPRKVCLSFESRDIGPELNRTSYLTMTRHMPVCVFDPQRKHSISITASPITQMKCAKKTDGYDVEFPIDGIMFRSLHSLLEPWNSVMVLGVSRLKVACLQLDYDENYQQEEPAAPISFESLLYIGWAVCDEVRRVYCTLVSEEVSEFEILEADRTKFADRQYGRLVCGHLVVIKVSSEQSDWEICPTAEIHLA